MLKLLHYHTTLLCGRLSRLLPAFECNHHIKSNHTIPYHIISYHNNHITQTQFKLCDPITVTTVCIEEVHKLEVEKYKLAIHIFNASRKQKVGESKFTKDNSVQRH